jgi:hypothetical protein
LTANRNFKDISNRLKVKFPLSIEEELLAKHGPDADGIAK